MVHAAGDVCEPCGDDPTSRTPSQSVRAIVERSSSQSSTTSSNSVEAGDVRQSIDFTSKAALNNSPKIPGAEVEVAK